MLFQYDKKYKDFLSKVPEQTGEYVETLMYHLNRYFCTNSFFHYIINKEEVSPNDFLNSIKGDEKFKEDSIVFYILLYSLSNKNRYKNFFDQLKIDRSISLYMEVDVWPSSNLYHRFIPGFDEIDEEYDIDASEYNTITPADIVLVALKKYIKKYKDSRYKENCEMQFQKLFKNHIDIYQFEQKLTKFNNINNGQAKRLKSKDTNKIDLLNFKSGKKIKQVLSKYDNDVLNYIEKALVIDDLIYTEINQEEINTDMLYTRYDIMALSFLLALDVVHFQDWHFFEEKGINATTEYTF